VDSIECTYEQPLIPTARRIQMGIAIGTTITVTFDAQQIAQLDCLLQNVEELSEMFESSERAFVNSTRVINVYRALHAAGYR